MKHTKWLGAFAAMAVILLASACGDPGDDAADGTTTETSAVPARSDACRELEYEEVDEGGELVDLAHLSTAGELSSFDPQAVATHEESQITLNLFDGLTDIDFTDTCDPQVKGRVAESWEANDDATQFTFLLRDGEVFSNGEPVLPSSFKLAWERLGSPDLAATYGALVTYFEGGDALLDGEVSTLDAVVADDEARTLTVTLAHPNADFPQVVSGPWFSPISTADLDRVGTSAGWGTEGLTIGNGPFRLLSAGAPDTDDVVLVRNERWAGNIHGDTRAKLDRLVFRPSQQVDSAFQAFESGTGDTATIPAGRYAETREKFPNTVDAALLGVYLFDFGIADDAVGGDDNVKLRQAISLAIDRDEINRKAYEGARAIPTGITPPGVPGFVGDLCEYCVTDQDRARELYEEWVDDGGELAEPLRISFNSDGGHENLVAIMAANLESVLGIDVELDPIEEDYYGEMAAEGACQICFLSWFADYPSYSNFMADLFSAASIDGANLGRYDDDEFERLIGDAREETDPQRRGELYVAAERRLLNESVAAMPVNWYVGDQVHRDTVVNYLVQPLGGVLWERVGKKAA